MEESDILEIPYDCRMTIPQIWEGTLKVIKAYTNRSIPFLYRFTLENYLKDSEFQKEFDEFKEIEE